MKDIVIDAANQSLGRIATQVALALQGKTSAAYDPSATTGPRVRVIHVAQVKFTGRKLLVKKIRWHTGYIGGLREFTLKELWERKPAFVVRHAVSGMLPKSRQRDVRLRRLVVEL